MTSRAEPHLSAAPIRAASPLQVAPQERASSLLVSLIIFVGFFVVLMFLMWLTSVLSFTQVAVPVTLLEAPSGRGEHAPGYERDLEEPGMEELEELQEPQIADALEVVTAIAQTELTGLDSLDTDSLLTGSGTGTGDSRQAGPGGESDAIPRWERWEVRFTARGIPDYAQQLDSFGIELGAAGGGSPVVDYASNLTQATPTRKTGKGDQEKRLYFTWTGGSLRAFDLQLLARAGVKADGRIVMQFFPAAAENQLATLERQAAGNRSVEEIRKTVFGVRLQGPNYVFHVISQQYR